MGSSQSRLRHNIMDACRNDDAVRDRQGLYTSMRADESSSDLNSSSCRMRMLCNLLVTKGNSDQDKGN